MCSKLFVVLGGPVLSPELWAAVEERLCSDELKSSCLVLVLPFPPPGVLMDGISSECPALCLGSECLQRDSSDGLHPSRATVMVFSSDQVNLKMCPK